ncbi:MAG TPA: GTPase ObgE [Candidatus Saccharibacteria bacterium]|jgi:GTP-binding protein|nr:GTPase ObgE [Candidatus Saccharibacteria bacterium]
MFIDRAIIKLKGGDGGRGMVSFRKEKYIDKGGPDGGDGGDGGSIIFIGDNNISTLLDLKQQHQIKAEDGGDGFRRNQHGKNGDNKIVYVPLGTQVYDRTDLIADIKLKGQQEIIARGGEGGFGNAHFKSSTRQAPRVAEKGEPGQELEIRLELKTIADVGLVGLPNAGKSTLLSVITNARPEIADYQFTTLKPNIGIVKLKNGDGMAVADIPGLIEGAHLGKGLGDEFLKHIERTSVLLHLIDSTSDNIVKDYQVINGELNNYSGLDLSLKPRIVVLTKTDLVDSQWLEYQKEELSNMGIEGVMDISSTSHKNLEQLVILLADKVSENKALEEAQVEDDMKSDQDQDVPTLSLSSHKMQDAWSVEKIGERDFKISGDKITLFIKKTDFSNKFSVERLEDIFAKKGLMHKLIKLGYKDRDNLFDETGYKFKLN